MVSLNDTKNVEIPHLHLMTSTHQVDETAPPTDRKEKESIEKDNGQSVNTNPGVQLPFDIDCKDPPKDIQATADQDDGLHTHETVDDIEQEATFYQNLTHKVMDDDQTIRDASHQAGEAAYLSLVPGLMEKEKARIEIRSRQAILHLAYTDLRVKNLESDVKKLRNDIQGLPEDFEIAEPVSNPVYLHVLKRSSASEFRMTEELGAMSPHLQPALEVLLADGGPGSNETESGVSASSQGSPQFLRIRPKLLARHIEKIAGEASELRINRTRSGVNKVSAILFRKPFKIFCAYETQIRASVEELQTQIEKKANEVTESDDSAGKTQKTKHKQMEYDENALLADLKLLLEFLDVDLKPTLELRSKIKAGTATSIEYEDLWHLFNLGDNVIQTQQFTVPKVYRVINFTGGREILISRSHPESKPTPVDGFVIDCYNLGFDGTSFGPQFTSLSIRKYQGTRLITSLPVFPLNLLPSKEFIHKELLDRGSQYLELTKLPYAHKLLVGTTLDEPAEEVDAQIIIDTTFAINRNPRWHQDLDFDKFDLTQSDMRETQIPPHCEHNKFNEGCCGSDIVQKDLDMDKSKVDEYIKMNLHALGLFPARDLTENDKILLPYWAYGFVLRSRQWVTVKISDLSEVIYSNNFDSLVLPSGHKETVRALVRNHAKNSTNSAATSNLGSSMDLVRGKGKGLIILLHGEPGVGKTSTAECVADLTQRPLFPVTCGDIGETAMEVQNNLDQNFQLAHKWGCVLLLDEADVFMAKRNKIDLRRNAVVSVFLRTLEYYSGILFLTTNRVGSIDPAFKSRIHMSLFYPHLGLDATLQIYQILLDRTLAEQKASQKVDFKVKSKEIMGFAKSHFKRMTRDGLATWNGRQIRNAFQTAITLAEYSSQQSGAHSTTLGKEQFHIVAEASKEFDIYMKETLGATEADLAWREDVRYDRYGGHMSSNAPVARSNWGNERHHRHVGRNRKDPESESELSSDIEDDEDSDDVQDDEVLSRARDTGGSTTAKGKAVTRDPSGGESGTVLDQSHTKEYEDFLKFREAQKKRAK